MPHDRPSIRITGQFGTRPVATKVFNCSSPDRARRTRLWRDAASDERPQGGCAVGVQGSTSACKRSATRCNTIPPPPPRMAGKAASCLTTVNRPLSCVSTLPLPPLPVVQPRQDGRPPQRRHPSRRHPSRRLRSAAGGGSKKKRTTVAPCAAPSGRSRRSSRLLRRRQCSSLRRLSSRARACVQHQPGRCFKADACGVVNGPGCALGAAKLLPHCNLTADLFASPLHRSWMARGWQAATMATCTSASSPTATRWRSACQVPRTPLPGATGDCRRRRLHRATAA